MPYGTTGYTTVAEEYRGASARSGAVPREKHTPEKAERFSAAERLRWGRWLLCAVLFMALVVTKVQMPERFLALRSAYIQQSAQSIDYRAVFGAVGRAVSGEKSVQEVMGEVYMEVFHPSSVEVETVGATLALPYEALSQQDEIGILLAFPQHWADLGAWISEQWTQSIADTAGKSSDTSAETVSSAQQPESTPAEADDSAVETQIPNVPVYEGKALPTNASMEQRVLNLTYTTPVTGWLSSSFGYRTHPVDGENKFHYGLDIAAAEGTAIGAFAAGVVKAVGESSSLGNYVMLSHEGGLVTTYAHCSKVVAKSGASVQMGEKIAEVGHTGLATGAHLHFSMQQDDVYLNPIYYVSLEEAPQ